MVWLIGYALHLPPIRISQPQFGVTPLEWQRFYGVDILHCISATWLLLLASVILVREETWRNRWLLGLILVFSGLAPLVWGVDFQRWLPSPVAAYFNDKTGSLFPLFPWSAFMLAGAVCASWFLRACAADRERQFMAGLASAGVVLALLGRFLPPLVLAPGASAMSWRADPRSFLLRLGLVFLLLVVCWLYGLSHAPRRSALLDVSRQSLFVYAAHLLLLYAHLWRGRSLAAIVGRTHGPWLCAGASLALAVLMTVGARGWGALKRLPSLLK